MQTEDIAQQEQETVIAAEEPVVHSIDRFLDDNFFKAHPDKILGVPYQASGRFGEVTKYRGDLSALDRIQVPLDFLEADKSREDPTLSTDTGGLNLSAAVQDPAVADFLASVNEVSREQTAEVAQKRKRKKESPVAEQQLLVTEVPELNSFEEMYRRHNPAISRDELEVFLWYKSSIGKPLSRRWVNLLEEIHFNNLSQAEPYQVSETRVNEWVDRALLYFFNQKYLPAFLYLSGDIYARKFQLARDKEQIEAKHGPGVFEAQERALGDVFKNKYDNRLIIGAPGGEDNLVILPNSKFAENFFLEGLESMGEGDKFKIKKVSAPSSKNFGKPDFLKDIDTSEYRKDSFERLNLRDALSYWMLKSTPEIKENVNAADIIKYYINGSPVRSNLDEHATEAQVKAEKAQLLKFKASLQKEGERLFKVFLDEQLTVNDKVRLETEWNAKFNNYVPVDYAKVPVAFTMCKYYKGKIEELRPEKREAVAFVLSTGTGCLAYDVGVGKTASAIFTISAFMDAGYSKRPFICVPNQVYKQFIQEIKDFAPHIPVIEGYNLGEGYIENLRGPDGNIAKVPEGCITVMTYEGLEQIGFTDPTYESLFTELYKILDQGGESEKKPTARQKEGFKERLATLLGKGLRGSLYNIEDFGFDFGCYDEAHKLKKVFTSVKGEAQTDEGGKTSRGANPYQITSGTPSSIGLKAFMLNQYILKNNDYQNVLLLTATPFTNSPLEIFSMLAMLAYEQLQETDLNNIKNFFDTYIQTSTELVINPKLKPEFKQVITGFNNLVSMQALIRRYINYKTGEDVNVQRPNKYVLPYTHKLIEGTVIALPEKEKVETFLSMTPQQKAMMDDIIEYVEEKISRATLESRAHGRMGPVEPVDTGTGDEEEGELQSEGEEVDEDSLGDEEKKGVRTLRGMNLARNLALSPYLYEYSGLGTPDFHEYVESSPKLKYTCECIRSVKEYHEARNEPVSGQVIYMDRGIEYFGLIREYLIQEVGFKPHEVAIIKSGMPAGAKKGSKEFIKNLFNGELYNISTKLYDMVSDAERIKVIIGSSTIKEGINLQRFSSTLHDCWVDWNPTDFLQLQGRIWRQGNLFDNIRVVLPLVVDSMDIFIFQKLQEKTLRINTIWSRGRKNVLKLEEFDPAELKYALIRDPRTVAELKIVDESAHIESEVLGIKRLADRIERIKEQAADVNSNFAHALETLRIYRDFTPTNDKLKDAQRLAQGIMEVVKKQTDKQGKTLTNTWERRGASAEEIEQMSELEPLHKPYWFDGFNLAQRSLNKEVRDFINPSGIHFELDNTTALDQYKITKEKTIAALEERKAKLSEKDNIDRIVKEVVEEREAKKITFKHTGEVVADFAKLNYLLNDRKTLVVKKPEAASCPPMENGKLGISDAAIDQLERCLEREPQTRDQYYNPETLQYSPERQAVQQTIIDHLFKGVRCVTQGKPIAVFTGGSPGSGKTHFLREHAEYLLSPEVFHLDADEIRTMLPEYKGWNANITHRESQDIVENILRQLGEGRCRYDFIYDGTMNKASKYFTLIKKAKAMGYQTFIVFLEVPFGVARRRVLERYQKTGRYVPRAILEEFFQQLPSGKTRGQDSLDQLKGLVDGYVVVNGVDGQIISRGGAELPGDRKYGEFLNPVQAPEPMPAPALPDIPPAPPAPADAKKQAEGLIKTLKLSMKYLSGDERKTAESRIKTLQLSLKYL